MLILLVHPTHVKGLLALAFFAGSLICQTTQRPANKFITRGWILCWTCTQTSHYPFSNSYMGKSAKFGLHFWSSRISAVIFSKCIKI